jgi:hypothetical protein
LLTRLRLETHLQALQAEEIDEIDLLRSMGAHMLQQNMTEIMSYAEAARIVQDLFPEAIGVATAS